MALSAKEREKIIEEETLRYETRQHLHAQGCAQHPRRGRWFWWLGLGVLAYGLWCLMACGGGSCQHGAMGMGMGPGVHGKRCPYHGSMMEGYGEAQPEAAPGKSKE